jgi:hypothetical protein
MSCNAYHHADIINEMKQKLTAGEKEAFRKVGQMGGKARAAKMSAAQRQESARKAAHARWTKANEK